MVQGIKKIIRNLFVLTAPRKALYRQGDHWFKKNIMDPSYSWKDYTTVVNPYFKKYGFRFSMLESEYYSQCSGIRSDLYIPVTLYDYYILPYLNNEAWRLGFADKNMCTRIIHVDDALKHIDVMFPKCIICCINGHYFIGNKTLCSFDDAVQTVLNYDKDMIIKPSIDSHSGQGVKRINKEENSKVFITKLIKDYYPNFTVQEIVRQHEDLALFNKSSVNTVRITTYQDFQGKIKVLYASQRFGISGSVVDNTFDGAGGGFCGIMEDGTYIRKIHHYKDIGWTMMDNSFPQKVPYYSKIKDAVLHLHTYFPQFSLIGWDVSVTPDGHPVIIEYNFRPGKGLSQMANGPMFEKEDLDEIMEHVCKANVSSNRKIVIKYKDKVQYGIK